MSTYKHTYLLCICLLCIFSNVQAANIKNIRIGVKNTYTRIVFDLDQAPKIYNIKYLTSPNRIVIDFTEGEINRRAIKNTDAYPIIKKINGTNIRDNGFSIEVELSEEANFKHFILKPNKKSSHRLVLDITQGKHKSVNKTKSKTQEQTIIPSPSTINSRVTNYQSDSINLYDNKILTDATLDRLFQPFLGNTQLREGYDINSAMKNKSSVQSQVNNLLEKNINDNSPTFDIRGYKIKGNTLLKLDVLKNSVQPYTGKDKNFGDVQQTIEALELSYQKVGYGMVQVFLPEQELDKGIVKINVIEPKISRLTVQGADYYNLKNVNKSLVSLKPGGTPNTKLISQNLTLINENPAKKTTIQFLSSEVESELNALINIKDKNPKSYSFTFDNTGTDSTGLYRLGASYQHANLTNNDDVFNFQYTTSEKSGALSAYSLGYHYPLYSINSSLDVYAGKSTINSGVIQNYVKVTGQGSVFGIRFNQLLSKVGNYTHRLNYGFDYRKYDTNVTYLSGTGPTYPNLVVMPISLTYSGQWTTSGRATGFNISLHNNAFAKESDKPIFNESRTGAVPKYSIFRFGIEHAQSVLKTWQMRFAVTGQQTTNALVSGEQFGAGGATSVRGYNERDVANDKGIQSSIELYTPNIANSLAIKGDMRGLVFYDYASLSRNLPQASDKSIPSSISSVGVGMRLNYKEKFTFKMDVATALKDSISQTKGKVKLHMALKYSF